MKVALRVSSTVDHYPTVALVEITDELALCLLCRQEAFLCLLKHEKELSCIEFWDGSVDWYDPLDLERYGLEEIETKEFVECEGLIEEDPVRVEGSKLVVIEKGFFWRAYPKHGDTPMYTNSIPSSAIRAITDAAFLPWGELKR